MTRHGATRRAAVLAAAGLLVAGAAPAAAAPGSRSQPGPLPPLVEATELRPPAGGQPGEIPVPHDINNAGDVVGESGGRAVLWRGGEAIVLPGGEQGEPAVATQIDERGRVYVDIVGAGAYRWDDGEATPIETGAETVSPRKANDEGGVLVAHDGEGNSVYGLWDDGVFTRIPAPDGSNSAAFSDLSDAGHVTVGTLFPFVLEPSVAWLWHDGRFRLLSWRLANPVAVNRSSHAIGRVTGTTDGVLWRDGWEIPLALRPNDINDRGQVVGTRAEGDRQHAFLWDGGTLTRLGEVGRDLGNNLQRLYGPATVNEAGQAVGVREDASGEVRYTLWTGGWAIDLGLAGRRQIEPTPVSPLALNDRGQVVLTIRGEDGRPDRPVVWTITYPGDPAGAAEPGSGVPGPAPEPAQQAP